MEDADKILHGMSFSNNHLTSLASSITMGLADDKPVEQLDVIKETVVEAIQEAAQANVKYIQITGELETPNYTHLFKTGTNIISEIDNLRTKYLKGHKGEE